MIDVLQVGEKQPTLVLDEPRPTMKFPKSNFRVQFEISRSIYPDYQTFVHTFEQYSRWLIEDYNEFDNSYTYLNQWKVWMHPHGYIALRSPLLSVDKVGEVDELIRVLKTMNVTLGENCKVRVTYDTPAKSNAILKYLTGKAGLITTLLLFLCARLFQYYFELLFNFQGALIAEFVSYGFFGLLAISVYAATGSNESYEDSLIAASQALNFSQTSKVAGPSDSDEPNKESTRANEPDLDVAELAREIRYPLENIMAYTRFYQNNINPSSQHWKDLVEIMEQAINIREVINRVESFAPGTNEEKADGSSRFGRDLFRRTPRTMMLLPLTVRATDLLGEKFTAPSFALNVSERGACLLMPDKTVAVGQEIEIQNHQFAVAAQVRWVVQGKADNMVFAGVEFAHPVPSITQAYS